jgi:hypothetical protein
MTVGWGGDSQREIEKQVDGLNLIGRWMVAVRRLSQQDPSLFIFFKPIDGSLKNIFI